jgi:hypothetical protein
MEFHTGPLRNSGRPRPDLYYHYYYELFFFSVHDKMYGILHARNQRELIREIIIFAIFLILIMILMRFLWNKTLVKYISVLKPVDSLWHTFLLALGISMFKL